MTKTSGVYKITNTVTGDTYIGSSNNIYKRWYNHRCPSRWKTRNNQMYKDMEKFGVDVFSLEVLEECQPEQLIEREQSYVDSLKPTYNVINPIIDQYNRRKKAKKDNCAYQGRLCLYNNECLTFNALRQRFIRMKITHAALEAKKYLVN